MRFMVGLNDHMLTVDLQLSKVTPDDEPQDAPEPPAIFDVSSASTLIRPQYDHEGPVPVALGFQPNEGYR